MKNINLVHLKIFSDSKNLILSPYTGKRLIIKSSKMLKPKTLKLNEKNNKPRHFKEVKYDKCK